MHERLNFAVRECVDCGCDLQMGQFEYEQDLCFRCLEKLVSELVVRMDDFYPDWMFTEKESDKEIVKFLFEVVAEKYGYYKIA